MEYQTVWGADEETSTALDNLVKIVNEQIWNGWEPQGGLCSMTGHTDGKQTPIAMFCQAMIKRP